MEAAVRTAATLLGGEAPCEPLAEARSVEGFKCFTVMVGDLKLNLGVINGLGRVRSTLETALAGTHFVEVMSCPGGCAGGGGQPYNGDIENVRKRIQRIYDADHRAPTRSSHQNRSVAELYEEYLDRPLSDVSHHLLHREYSDRSAAATIEAPAQTGGGAQSGPGAQAEAAVAPSGAAGQTAAAVAPSGAAA
jgi:iron only hydrogenase large subunit-like protein